MHKEIVTRLPALFFRLQRKRRRQILISTHSWDLLSEKGIGGEEVIMLIPGKEGTEVHLANDDDEVRALLESGLSIADAATPEDGPSRTSAAQFIRMSIIPVNLAVEDRLSEAVIRTLLAHTKRNYAVGTAYGRGGFGYLRRTVRGWNSGAVGVPFVLLTDLDRWTCPQALIDDWLPVPKHHNLLFRVAVREVESWLLADSTNPANFLAAPAKLISGDVDGLADPKAELIALARRSRRRDIRDRLVPKLGSTAKVGPDYNACLIGFVTSHWRVDAAEDRSPSLARTLNRLRTFRPFWPAVRD